MWNILQLFLLWGLDASGTTWASYMCTMKQRTWTGSSTDRTQYLWSRLLKAGASRWSLVSLGLRSWGITWMFHSHGSLTVVPVLGCSQSISDASINWRKKTGACLHHLPAPIGCPPPSAACRVLMSRRWVHSLQRWLLQLPPKGLAALQTDHLWKVTGSHRTWSKLPGGGDLGVAGGPHPATELRESGSARPPPLGAPWWREVGKCHRPQVRDPRCFLKDSCCLRLCSQTRGPKELASGALCSQMRETGLIRTDGEMGHQPRMSKLHRR